MGLSYWPKDIRLLWNLIPITVLYFIARYYISKTKRIRAYSCSYRQLFTFKVVLSKNENGSDHDFYNIEEQFEDVTPTLENADVQTEGLFLNADAGFDSGGFRKLCLKKEINTNVCFNNRDRDEYLDQELYDKRFAVERTCVDDQLPLTAEQVRYSQCNLGRVQLTGIHCDRSEKKLKRKTRKKFKSLHI